MAKSSHYENDQFNEQETARRRDEVIKRMIAMPPKPHSEMKIKKRTPAKSQTTKRLKAKST
jgi:hypothetical protein